MNRFMSNNVAMSAEPQNGVNSDVMGAGTKANKTSRNKGKKKFRKQLSNKGGKKKFRKQPSSQLTTPHWPTLNAIEAFIRERRPETRTNDSSISVTNTISFEKVVKMRTLKVRENKDKVDFRFKPFTYLYKSQWVHVLTMDEEPCSKCDGYGYITMTTNPRSADVCNACVGMGLMVEPSEELGPIICQNCNGFGRVKPSGEPVGPKMKCAECNGIGSSWNLTVRIFSEEIKCENIDFEYGFLLKALSRSSSKFLYKRSYEQDDVDSLDNKSHVEERTYHELVSEVKQQSAIEGISPKLLYILGESKEIIEKF